ncbi:MAG: fibronectin type III domain-containing protein [Candidatus Methanoperedens sp.]|nr:fibronectin type III domain-containing protein [Candidatus Methanoperedens sp.]
MRKWDEMVGKVNGGHALGMVGITALMLILLTTSASAATTVTLYQPSSSDITENSVRLTWSQSGDLLFSKYEVYKRIYGIGNWIWVADITSKSTTSYTVTGLLSGTYYEFKISDVDWFGYADSNIIGVTTKSNSKPNTPILSNPSDGANVGTLTPTFTWSAFSDPDPGNMQSTYNIRIWEAPGPNSAGTIMVLDKEYSGSASSVTPSSSDYIYGGLVNGKWYHWHVRVKDNNGAWSDWAADTTSTYMDFKVVLNS